MIDIHHHLLYGLDDGAKDIETSLAMAEMAIADGITHVVCTPHASDEYEFRPDLNAARLAVLREKLRDRITLGLGCDFHLSYDNIEDALANPTKYSINGKRYLLVEFPDFGIPRNIGDSFHEMMVAGMVPILTHPERNLTLMQDLDRMKEWIDMGCLVQITAGSVLGRFGKGPRRVSEDLLRRRWVHILATDAHNTSSRPPTLKDAYKRIAQEYSESDAESFCVETPRAIFYGEPLANPPTPEAADSQEHDTPAKHRWWPFGHG